MTDIEAYQRKNIQAYAMSQAIKRFVDEYGELGNSNYRKRIKEMLKAYEGWKNA